MEISDETKIQQLNSSINEHSTWGREQQEPPVLDNFEFLEVVSYNTAISELRTNEN